MTRRALLSGLVGAGCASKRPVALAPPEQVGTWRRSSLAEMDHTAAPEPALALRPAQWVRAEYESETGLVRVDAFGMPSEASAFELQQKWRRGEGVTSFYRGTLFAACSSDTLSGAALVEFATRLEAAWPAGTDN